MVQHLHAFLYTIAVILQSSGVDARLRSLCFKAWTIQLTAHEQELLILTCNILGTVGGVLSEPSISENWITDSADRSNMVQKVNENVDVKAFSGESCEQQDALRERVVDLLFSRVTLQPLQNYVCTQVEAALEREVERLCCQGKRNYSYAVGLLAMANRMCETRAIGNGDCDVAARHQVLQAASRLLAFAPEVNQ
ncbi:hypothetical protein ANCDUO_08733 [Ancylostoma duodenale]|uniref:Uncharacterized protein n=1 Tax=Ancylostoma duodenale TaxID=51022 RepID=A0A0C2CVS7_9BILA|nr:hypothetical protein ANCDUO_08733 [Ancylostoma duodenale]